MQTSETHTWNLDANGNPQISTGPAQQLMTKQQAENEGVDNRSASQNRPNEPTPRAPLKAGNPQLGEGDPLTLPSATLTSASTDAMSRPRCWRRRSADQGSFDAYARSAAEAYCQAVI